MERGLRNVGSNLVDVLSNVITLSMRSTISSSDVVDLMRWVTRMESLILGFSFGKPLPFFASLLPLPLPLESAALLSRSSVVLREVATNSQSPMVRGSDSSEVVGAIASNRATALMNSFRSEGRVMNNPVGEEEVRLVERLRSSLRAVMMGADPAASSSLLKSPSLLRGVDSTSEGTSVVEASCHC